MAVVKKREAAKQRSSTSLGRKFVRFKTSNSDRHFAVHEDLICSSSAYFKGRLQKTRKAVDGECSICHEDLDPRKDDITFCRASCGQNVHETCIEQWNQARAGPTTCPLCRKFWKQKNEDLVILDKELDSDAVQLYLDWLYTGEIQIDEDIDRAEEDYNLLLLKAWTVSDEMCDSKFRHALVAEYVSAQEDREDSYFWLESAKYAFDDQNSGIMRQFVADAFLVTIDPHWFENDSEYFPAAFTHALCRSILQSMREKPGNRKLLEVHANNEYEMEENEEQAVFSESEDGDEGVD